LEVKWQTRSARSTSARSCLRDWLRLLPRVGTVNPPKRPSECGTLGFVSYRFSAHSHVILQVLDKEKHELTTINP
jgi:hypothetical protein